MNPRKSIKPLALALVLALPLSAQADEAPLLLADAAAVPRPPEPPSLAREVRHVMLGHQRDAQRVVKGAPYCADAIHETVHWLIDPSGGAPNKISRKTSSRTCRDGEGRTRQEVTRPDGKRTVHLHDPVSDERWVLDPERKVARAVPTQFEFKPGEMGGQMREWARELRDKVRDRVRDKETRAIRAKAGEAPAAPEPVTVTRNETVSEDGKERHVEVRIVRSGEGMAPPPHPPVPPMAPQHPLPPGGEHDMVIDEVFDSVLPAGVAGRARAFAPRGEGVTTPLPSKEVDGLRVNGERTTWTIEAGKIGNEKPIVSTREVWTSPELLLTVSSREFDPRRGENSYRLSNLKRGEPDANLFKVPAEYEKQRGLRGLPLTGKG